MRSHRWSNHNHIQITLPQDGGTKDFTPRGNTFCGEWDDFIVGNGQKSVKELSRGVRHVDEWKNEIGILSIE